MTDESDGEVEDMLENQASAAKSLVTFDTSQERYRHWTLEVDGRVARLVLAVDEFGGLQEGYRLKLNSYDLGVDIELADALQRIRFEHPQVGAVVLTSGLARMFCAGANIYMLGQASHAWKVNFCKFTNETRNGIEDSSAHSGLKFIAALNGTTAGGGYEMALACDEIVLVDDRSSAVSLPEVPLLGVLPGTGGLTRLTDKRRVRRDLADLFCTNADGVRGARAKDWGLVDAVVPPSEFDATVTARANDLAVQSDRPTDAEGVALAPLDRRIDDTGFHYPWVDVVIDRDERSAEITISVPENEPETELESILAQGCAWWPLAMARELDDAVLLLRANEPEIGTWLLRTAGEANVALAHDDSLLAHAEHWYVREVIGQLRRTFQRLDATSRSLIAVIDQGSCFAGTLFELSLLADRSYMLDLSESDEPSPTIHLGNANFGPYTALNGLTRLANRFYDDDAVLENLHARQDHSLGPEDALELGLVTVTPDDLDWDEELRLAVEERAALSPDALTGLEASLRFGGRESLETKIFGRLSAWQNWIFTRPNAVGDKGALTLFGSGSKSEFDWKRV